jgi:DNA-binding transcriptional regulator YiaG
MKKKYESEIMQVCHEGAEAMYKIGAIDAARMREYDALCFADASKPETIRQPVRELKPAAALARA